MTLLTSSMRTHTIPSASLGFPSLGSAGSLANPGYTSLGEVIGEGLQQAGSVLTRYAEKTIDMDRQIDWSESRVRFKDLASGYVDEAMKAPRGQEHTVLAQLAAAGAEENINGVEDRVKRTQRALLWDAAMAGARADLKPRVEKRLSDDAETALTQSEQDWRVSIASGVSPEDAIRGYINEIASQQYRDLLGDARIARRVNDFAADAYRERFEFLIRNKDPENAETLMMQEDVIRAIEPDERRWRIERAKKEMSMLDAVEKGMAMLIGDIPFDSRQWPKDELTNNRITAELLERGIGASQVTSLFVEHDLEVPDLLVTMMEKSFEKGEVNVGYSILGAVAQKNEADAMRIALYSKANPIAPVMLTMRNFVDDEVLIGTVRAGAIHVPNAIDIIQRTPTGERAKKKFPETFDPVKILKDGMNIGQAQAEDPAIQRMLKTAFIYEMMRQSGAEKSALDGAIRWLGRMLVDINGQYGDSSLFNAGTLAKPTAAQGALSDAVRFATGVETTRPGMFFGGIQLWNKEYVQTYQAAPGSAFKMDGKAYIPYGNDLGPQGFVEWNPITSTSRNITKDSHGLLFLKARESYFSVGYSDDFDPTAWLKNKPHYGVKTLAELRDKYQFDATPYIMRYAQNVWLESYSDGASIAPDDEEGRAAFAAHADRILHEVFGYSDW